MKSQPRFITEIKGCLKGLISQTCQWIYSQSESWFYPWIQGLLQGSFSWANLSLRFLSLNIVFT
jgi:hypothetical protein